MGGGAVWSRVARLASRVSPAVGRAASPLTNSCRFCKMNASLQSSKQASSGNMHSCSCPPETTKSLNVSQRIKSMWDSDEWEFAEEEEKIDHLVFGRFPSQQEVEEASTDLQDALRLGLLAPACDDLQGPLWGTLMSPAVSHAERSAQSSNDAHSQHSGRCNNTMETNVEEIPRPASPSREPDWKEPPPIRSSQNALDSQRINSAQGLLYQIGNNPAMKEIAVSLVNDPNIWGAVMANKEIQEFRRKLRGDEAMLLEDTDTGAVVLNDGDNNDNNTSSNDNIDNLFHRCHMFLESQISQFMNVIHGLMGNLFRTSDKKVIPKEIGGELFDMTMKSCTLFAIIVIFIVVLKRLSVQAA